VSNFIAECEHECAYVIFLSPRFSKSKRFLQNMIRFTSAALGEYLFAVSTFVKCQKRKSNRDITVAMWRVSKEQFLQISWEMHKNVRLLGFLSEN
jgi:hypothetical protein